jgi:hypothetical protein
MYYNAKNRKQHEAIKTYFRPTELPYTSLLPPLPHQYQCKSIKLADHVRNKTGDVHINVILRCICVTTATMEKQ